jgi:hypothetical protein
MLLLMMINDDDGDTDDDDDNDDEDDKYDEEDDDVECSMCSGLTELPARVPNNTRELWLQNNSLTHLTELPYLHHLHTLRLTANHIQVRML